MHVCESICISVCMCVSVFACVRVALCMNLSESYLGVHMHEYESIHV